MARSDPTTRTDDGIDTDDLPNWRRWPVKEANQINCGYRQAYLNTARATHFALINTRTFDLQNEATVTACYLTHGNWKSSSRPDKRKEFEGTTDDLPELIAQAEATVREWLAATPCDRSGEQRDAVEALTDVATALHDEGLVLQPDSSLTGWTRRFGSTGFSIVPVARDDDGRPGAVAPAAADQFRLNVEVDGKRSGLTYETYKEVQNDEVMQFHDPCNPEQLVPAVERALTAAGFTPAETTKGCHQTHWDHAVGYRSTVELPDDLAVPDASTFKRRTGR